MSPGTSVVLRCGRCGRRVHISTSQLLKLRKFDCDQCLAAQERQPNSGQDHGREAGCDPTQGVTRAGPSDFIRALNSRERSIVLRTVLGFSKEEITEAYGIDTEELRRLLLRVVALIGRRH